MNITDQAAQVLAEIDDATAEALAWENLAWEKSLRCLKTAIEGLLPLVRELDDIPNSAGHLLTTLITQWNSK